MTRITWTPGSTALDPPAHNLPVLDNDLPGVLGTMEIDHGSMTTPATARPHSTTMARPHPLDDYIVYTPNGGVLAPLTRSNTRSRTPTGAARPRSRSSGIPLPADQTVRHLLRPARYGGQSAHGRSASAVSSCSSRPYRTCGVFRRCRLQRRLVLEGIFAVFLDVLYDRNLVSPNFDAANDLGFEITFSSYYGTVRYFLAQIRSYLAIFRHPAC